MSRESLYLFLLNSSRPFTFERVIRDALAHAEFRARGVARWSPLPAGAGAGARARALAQAEEGELVGTGAAVRAAYTWHWADDDDDGGATIRFPDARVFVEGVDVSRGPCAVAHSCAPDSYAGVFAVDDDGALRVTWRVTGPRKDYVSETRFSPRAADDKPDGAA